MPRIPNGGTAHHIAVVAGRVFFSEGIDGIHVDRIAALADVTKRTLYRHYRSRDALIAAAVRTPSPLAPDADDGVPPLTRIERMFARLAAYVASPGFHGCPYANAAARFARGTHPARLAIREVKDGRRRWMRDRLTEAGIAQADELAEELAIVFDGALSTANVRMSHEPALAAQRLVARLLRDAPRSARTDGHAAGAPHELAFDRT